MTGTTTGAMEVITGVTEAAGGASMVLLIVGGQETPDLARAGVGGG